MGYVINIVRTFFHIGPTNHNKENALSSLISLQEYMFKMAPLQPKIRGVFSRFVYDSCAANFVGRQQEIELLEGFLEAEEKVLWWAITGSAGKGKTRLAYEFASRINRTQNWMARFIRWQLFQDDMKNCEFTYDNIGCNLLLIFDYVYAYQTEIAKWIVKLVKNYQPNYKIRILLIEREDDKIDLQGRRRKAPWEEIFVVDSCDSSLMKRLKYQNENLNLNSMNLTKRDAERIAESYCASTGRELSQKILDKILFAAEKSNNNVFSPLQVLLLTEYYTNPKISSFSDNIYQTALESLVERELNILYSTLAFDNRIQMDVLKKIMVLATIVGSVETELLLSDDYLKIIGRKEECLDVVERLKKNVMCVYEVDGRYYIKGIQPDLIGEYLVYTIFAKMNQQQILETIDCIKKNEPEELSRFLLRFVEDVKRYNFKEITVDIFAPYLPEEDYIFTLMNDQGETITCEVLFTFESETTGKDYIVYTDNTTDEDGNTRVYASIYDADCEQSRLFPIETQKEWRTVEIILEELRDSLDEDDIEQIVGNRLLEEKLDGV